MYNVLFMDVSFKHQDVQKWLTKYYWNGSQTFAHFSLRQMKMQQVQDFCNCSRQGPGRQVNVEFKSYKLPL